MRIVIVGAGQVGSTVVEALHAEHDLSVIDVARERLEALAYRFDVRTIEANVHATRFTSSRARSPGSRRRRPRP